MRTLAHILVAVTVVSSTLWAVPCACEASGHALPQVESEQGGEHDCCGSHQVPEEPEHDCPHCLTGSCGIDGAEPSHQVLGADLNESPAPAAPVVCILGFESPSPALVASGTEVDPTEEAPPPGALAGWDTCVRLQVIRR